jgi:hypothetical protein
MAEGAMTFLGPVHEEGDDDHGHDGREAKHD